MFRPNFIQLGEGNRPVFSEPVHSQCSREKAATTVLWYAVAKLHLHLIALTGLENNT